MAPRRMLGLAALLVATGCVHARPESTLTGIENRDARSEAPPRMRMGEPIGEQIAARAERYLKHGGTLVRDDCSGLVETVYSDLGLYLPTARDVDGNAVKREYVAFKREHALRRRHPRPGDLAFFQDTYDRNHDGRIDDPLTHVAIVASVDAEGTATLVHYGSHGLATFHMNLRHPTRRRDASGRRINDNLRIRRRGDPRHTKYLASQLFVAFGRAPRRPEAIAQR